MEYGCYGRGSPLPSGEVMGNTKNNFDDVMESSYTRENVETLNNNEAARLQPEHDRCVRNRNRFWLRTN